MSLDKSQKSQAPCQALPLHSPPGGAFICLLGAPWCLESSHSAGSESEMNLGLSESHMPCSAAGGGLKPSTVLSSILKRHTYRTPRTSLSLLSIHTRLLCPRLTEGSPINACSVRNIWPWEMARRFGPGSSGLTLCSCDPTGNPPGLSMGLGQGWPGKPCLGGSKVCPFS